jgi:UDP:flavonoid glycosyltransferase YjiC (YdhE family)
LVYNEFEKMKILIPTIGSRGDVQPFIALAQGLKRAGHTVTLASHPLLRELVESHAVAFSPVGPDIDLAQEVAAIQRGSKFPAAGLVRVMRFGMDVVEAAHDDILVLCRNAELVVVSAQSAAGKNEADQFFWAEKVYELGVGPRPIRRANLDGKSLVNGLSEIARKEQMRINAANLGEKIRAERGIEDAVHLIEETFL